MWGGRGSDKLFGGSGVDDMFGGKGADRITGGPKHDYLWGYGGNDVIKARDGHKDDVYCGAGVDRIYIDNTKDTRDFVWRQKHQCEFVDGRDIRKR